MKKALGLFLIGSVMFLTAFVITYLALCYLPGMRIKLVAPPFEYFVESLKNSFGFKTAVSSALGIFFGVGSAFVARKMN